MIGKSLIAAFALAGTLATALPAAEAQAGVDVSIGIGTAYPPAYGSAGWSGGYDGGYDGGYGGGYGGWHGGWHGSAGYYPDANVSCGEGRRILKRYGYQGIEVQSCRRSGYVYTAWRNGRQFLMRVSVTGDVSRVRRIG